MIIDLLCIQFVAVAFRSEEEVLKKGTAHYIITYFCPALGPPLGGSGRKTTTLVRDLEYFIHTKIHQNLLSGFGEEVENVNCLTDDRRRTDAGQRMITIGHWSLRLLCPKKHVYHQQESNSQHMIASQSGAFDYSATHWQMISCVLGLTQSCHIPPLRVYKRKREEYLTMIRI